MKLSKAEEELMTYIWELKESFLKDLLLQYKEPIPAPTTIATLLKRMTEKGFIDFKTMGRSRKYFPLVSKKDYVKNKFQGFVKNFFGDSSAQFASFFTQSTDLTDSELKNLRSMIDEKIKNKKS